MPSTLIINATLVNEGEVFEADLRIEDGRIARIGSSLTARGDEMLLDAGGRLLLPGLIDTQVQFREPGFALKGDLATESAAAVAGGITSYFDLPNTQPPTLDATLLEAKYAAAAGRSHANFAFWQGANAHSLEAIQGMDPGATPGLRICLDGSDAGLTMHSSTLLEAMFRECPTLICANAEDLRTIDSNLTGAKAEFGESVPVQWHPTIRSRQACVAGSEFLLGLARQHQARLHVAQLSSVEELRLFSAGRTQNKRITADAGAAYLHFDDRHYAMYGNRIKCDPAIKAVSDREALMHAVVEGRIDVLSSAHAPHTLEDKSARYLSAPSGMPMVQSALACLLERYFEGRFSLPLIVEKCCHAPAALFGIEQRGYLREGYWADLVLVDLKQLQTVRSRELLGRVGWSPFDGHSFQASIAATFVNGNYAWDGSQLFAPSGQRLAFSGNRR